MYASTWICTKVQSLSAVAAAGLPVLGSDASSPVTDSLGSPEDFEL